jgi:Chaperone of endosialidase
MAGKQTDNLIAGIYGKTIASGAQVIIGSGGKLATIQSSARYKDGIRPMEEASEAILSLKPVTFRYKHELDPSGIAQFGLVAEEVEKMNPDLSFATTKEKYDGSLRSGERDAAE